MKHRGSVFTGIFIAGLIGIAIGIGGGCSDNGTGGGAPEGTLAVSFMVSEVVCPDASPLDTVTDRVKAECLFVPVHGGPAYVVNFQSPGVMAADLEPGEYEVRVRSGRCDGEVIMPGTLTVVNMPGSLAVQYQAAAGAVPSMRVIDGTLRLTNMGVFLDPDTMSVSFKYSRDEVGLGMATELELINRLNNATGRHFIARKMRREIEDFAPMFLPYITVRYTFPIDNGVYVNDLLERCYDYMGGHSDLFPRGVMAVDARRMIPCMNVIDFDPGGIIMDQDSLNADGGRHVI